MLIKTKIFNLSSKFDIFFSYLGSLLYLKGLLGLILMKLPSYFFFSCDKNKISFVFLDYFKFFAVFAHFLYLYKRLFYFYFVRLRIKGLGFRLRLICNSLFRFFFGSTNFLYFHVPTSIMLKLKKRHILLISNDLSILKTLLAHLLLLKKLSVYFIRGLVYPRQIFILKVGKKRL